MQEKLVHYWALLKNYVNARSQRERVLLLVTGVVLIWSFMFNLYITPFSNTVADSSEELSNLEQQFEGTHHELLILQQRVKKQIPLETSAEFQQLNAILLEHNKQLDAYRNKLIAPEKVPYLLESMLNDFSGLTLVNIETLTPAKLLKESEENNDKSPSLYRQAIKMSFTGEYQDLLHYVKKIESLPYPLWWEALEFKITQFPQAQIVLTVYTLSEHVNWIGV
ncbi:MAG: type II secretion system protein M [Gammaproteobacteria bacterium]|jgi:MSHA biogenesis protein MshJ|nr:type II secretion system protein M [Gammaproteobacteria bacterium]